VKWKWNAEEIHVPSAVPLPTNGRAERFHLYEWIVEEEVYVQGKFERGAFSLELNDEGMKDPNLLWWERQIMQYMDRARLALNAAESFREDGDEDKARFMELKAQQAHAKLMMTAKGCVEASIRAFGNMPLPGVESGDVREWEYE